MDTALAVERRAYARTHPMHWENIEAKDIPSGWIDDMVRRLFEEWNAQMIRIERASAQVSDAKNAQGAYNDTSKDREQDARTLARMQRSLEGMVKMEMARAAHRKSKSTLRPGQARAELAAQLLVELEHAGADELRQETDR